MAIVVIDAWSPNYNSRSGAAIDCIVIHDTESDTAVAALSWFESPESQVSAHYVIDRDGTIVDIQDMARLDDPSDQSEAARYVYPSAAPYWYALEVNSGWFLQHGVGVGQQIVFCLGG